MTLLKHWYLKFDEIKAYQVFQIIRFSVLLCTGIVMVKLGYSTEVIGLFEFFLLLASMGTTFWVTGVSKNLLAIYTEQKDKSIFQNHFVLLLMYSMVSIGVLFAFKSIIINKFGISEFDFNYELLFPYVLFTGPAALTEWIWLIKKRRDLLIIYPACVFFVQLVLIIYVVYLRLSYHYLIYVLIAISFVRFIVSIIVTIKYSGNKIYFNPNKFYKYFQQSFPFVLGTLLAALVEFIDGWIVSGYLGIEQFAIYRYGAKEFPLIVIMASSFSNAFVSKIAEKECSSEALNELKKRSLNLMHVFFPVSAILLIISHFAFVKIFSQQFEASATIFNVFILLIISRLVFPQTILTALKSRKVILLVAITEVVVNIIISIIFVDEFGIIGVAFGTLVAYTLEKIIFIFVLYLKYGIPAHKYISLKYYVCYTIFILIIFGFVEIIAL